MNWTINNALLQAWMAVEQIFPNNNPETATIYEEYWSYLVSMTENLEEGMTDTVHCKVNVVDTDSMQSYVPANLYYNKATNIVAYMGERDVDIIQLMLECNHALRD